MKTIKQHITRQNGAVLIVSLIILLVLTVIGVSAMSTSSLEEKMTGNLRDQDVSFQAAESALADGEHNIYGWVLHPTPTASANNSVWTRDAMGTIASLAYNDNWWNTKAIEFGASTATNLSNLYADPRFIVEELAFKADSLDPNVAGKGIGIYYYRVTARAHGLSQHALTILQSTYAHRYN